MAKIQAKACIRAILFTIVLFCSFSSEAATAPDTVKIGSYVISIHDINFHDKEYVIRFWVWMEYKNPNLDFSHRVEVPNAKEMEVQDIMSDTIDGRIWVLMKLKCTMKQSWNVHDFPFDYQTLDVHIENSEFDTRSLLFVADTAGKHYDPKLTIDGWKISDFTTSAQLTHYETNFGDNSIGKSSSDYATYHISLDIHRNAWGLFFKLFIGMYIAFMIAFISFYIDHAETDPRFGLPVGGLFASIGNKYIIDSILPESSIFTLVDMIHATTFMSIFVILAVSVYTLRIHDLGKVEWARRIDRIARNLVMGIYVVVNVTMVAMAILN